ncbi:hypothetical protein V3H24_23855 [Vibrio parahaemolyticus]|uniref:hypothetical protein n=1 Tax=Vibrio parahaemolyticus TaxID=670 RepID=UPI001A215947|nr:hypothetical protein [Vibrio parahaemolyticus]MDF4264810.1 hypothetical protein [Vibrio parahaemolyticus]MDF4326745.1 hypothetical protein [Vibrio parahaemolyticus]MDF4981131.1 hypothetical protein [Vibrio parahaemolyticus]MDG2555329.1 hypothetical protein [Vibrio parahaemolyticus]
MSDNNENNGEIVPFGEIQSSGVDLNLAVQQAQQMHQTLGAMGITKATFETGAVYHNDKRNNTVTMADNGLLVQSSEHSTIAVFRNEGSTVQETLAEVQGRLALTQEVLGAFSGKSQPWTSNQLSSPDQGDD